MTRPLTLGFDGRGRPLRLADKDRKTHMHVIGSSGSGKSKFLEHLMRQDLVRRQGFCLIDPHGTLYDAVLDWASHQALDRKIIPLNLSNPDKVVGFNPFQRAPKGDVSVQVDHRINATMHAWGVADTDNTPTLARTMWLIYTVMIEHNLGLPQVQHLIDFSGRQVRQQLIDKLKTRLIAREWMELQALKAKDWRDEIMSAKNRLLKLLTSPTLDRVMGLPGRSINLSAIIEEGSFLLVNLARSDYLSPEQARVFGALVLNEFFECGMRRQKDSAGNDPSPYYLYLDEFQNFVSPDIAGMLDEIRKKGIFLTLAHQRFGQLDEDIIDAVLTNCGIKAVFGGLRAESAELMARELFIGKLDPMKVMAAIYQTKFWPVYGRDQVYTHGTSHTSGSSHGTSSGNTHSQAAATFAGSGSSQAYFSDWFSIAQPTNMSTETSSTGASSMSGSSESWGESSTDSESFGESESVADVPIFIPVPFQELSSVQFMSIADQLHQMTVALKEQFPRHCFIKVQQQETQPLLVPKVEDYFTTEENLLWYRNYQLDQLKALPAPQVDRLLAEEEQKFLEAAGVTIDITEPESGPAPRPQSTDGQPQLPRKPKSRKAAAPEAPQRAQEPSPPQRNVFDDLEL